ncbi:MAG: nicotinate (nicotinamide) nucleotide adenylyltransferase [Nitrospira sp.]|nr:nicotinate (nicotinamide) nucleotide adenylyltransferase [bacterium]MBL7049177.1 nicotinate (nicotinamide) nucleotide adenylyltransferase [Nitrospira sp.]
MRIGLYGGTFNPFHYGHLRTVEEVAGIMQLDRVIIIPAGKTPFDKPDLAPAADRYEMVKCAITDHPLFSISSIEMNGVDRSYTVDTLRALKEELRGSSLFFILGIDAFLDLPLWKQPEKIVEMVDLIVISRQGNTFLDLLESSCMGGVSSEDLRGLDTGMRGKLQCSLFERGKGHLCKVTPVDISASCIRARIGRGESVSDLLPDSVNSYILLHNLYK